MAAQPRGAAILRDEPAAGRVDGCSVGQDLARRRQALDPGGDGDGWTADGAVGRLIAVPRRGDDLTRGQADPDLERLLAFGLELRERGPHREGAEPGPEGIVVVDVRITEHGEDRIADELLAPAPEPPDGGVEGRQRGVDPLLDVLGIVLAEHPDVIDEVGEQGRDDPPIAAEHRRRRAKARIVKRALRLGQRHGRKKDIRRDRKERTFREGDRGERERCHPARCK